MLPQGPVQWWAVSEIVVPRAVFLETFCAAVGGDGDPPPSPALPLSVSRSENTGGRIKSFYSVISIARVPTSQDYVL